MILPGLFLNQLLESFQKSQSNSCDSGAAFFFLQLAVCVYKGHSSQIIGNRKSAYLKAQGQILPPAMCAPGEQGKGVTVLTHV